MHRKHQPRELNQFSHIMFTRWTPRCSLNYQYHCYPPGIQAAPTLDRSLMYDRGHGVGKETKVLGITVILGPVCGPLGQFVQGVAIGRGLAAIHTPLV